MPLVERVRTLERRQRVPTMPEGTFEFFADPRNLEAITPPWLRFRIVSAPARLERESLLTYRLRLFGFPIRWHTRIAEWLPPHAFTDVQLKGPYRLWEHTHRLTPVGEGTEIHDHVRYRLPLEPISSLVSSVTVERWLDAIFDYRAEQIDRLLR